jgi:hypothetical protein
VNDKIATSLTLTVLALGFSVQGQTPTQPVANAFRTPSNNIYCIADGENNAIRCDLASISSKALLPQPKDCELDWGQAFGMAPRGKSYMICHGDTIVNTNYRLLAYGQTWKFAGFSCLSQRTGLRCTNRDQHGFELSKGKQRLF